MYNSASRETDGGFLHAVKSAEAASISGEVATSPGVFFSDTFGHSDTFYRRYGKRCLDVLGAMVALVLVLPFLPVLALIIKLSSPGPILYRSIRLGQDGRPFVFYKFRSMVDGAHESRKYMLHMNEAEGPVFKISNDPRITRVGAFLRRSSVDEIPQLWNVLRGDMSLVGPRPPIPEEVEKYEPWQKRRLDVNPGITCLWQISGRSNLGFEEWMRLDIQYIEHRSFALDCKILLETIPVVLSRDGAY